MNLEILRKIGLTNGETRVYGSILELGSAPVSKIHERTGLERRSVYDILNKLIEKGLISYITEKKKKFYQISHPNKILTFIEEKEDELKNIKGDIKKEIPQILELYDSQKQQIKAEVYRGKEGIKSIFEDMLNYKKNYFIGGGFYIMDLLPYYWPQYNKRRIKKEVHWYSLSLYETKRREIPEKRFFDLKYLPEELSINPSVVFIFGNKIANVLWGKEWFAFIVESKEIADSYRRYHEYLWCNIAKK